MLCPACRKSMLVLELDQVEIDYCPGCGGIWLDSGELELLTAKRQKDDILLNSPAVVVPSREKATRCPICRKKMIKILVGPDRSIILDKCAKKHGFWLNKGELESVLRLAGKIEPSPVLNMLKNIFENKT